MQWRCLSVTTLFLALSAAAGALAGQDPAMEAVCPRAAGPVTLDGKLDEPAWRDAAAIGPFPKIGARLMPERDLTRVKLLYDETALILAVTCAAPAAGDLRRGARDDGGIWRQDHVEVFLNPRPEWKGYYHLVVDRAGTLLDALHDPDDRSKATLAWNGEWQAAVAPTAEGWAAEIRIPFAALGVKGVSPGDLWRLKVGRDGGKDGPLMWPGNPTSSFHTREADGSLYFGGPNLLENGDFEAGDPGAAVPKAWSAALTSPEVRNERQGEVRAVPGGSPSGKQALRLMKLPTALYWPQVWSRGYRLEPGGIYEFSLRIEGDIPQVNLRANGMAGGQRVKLSKGVAPTKEPARYAFTFVVPEKTEEVSVGIAAPAGASGEVLLDDAVLKRVLVGDEAARVQAQAYAPPDWSPDPDPVHGLTSLCERAGRKPWDLFWRGDHLFTHRVILRDRKLGTEMWLLDHSPVREYGVTASIWPAWNADCSVMWLPERRLAPTEPRRPWVVSADFSRMAPAPATGMPLWDLENPDVYYTHAPGKVEKWNLRTGEGRVLATWEPRARERSYGLTKDNRSVFVVDHDGGTWVRWTPGEKALPYIQVLDCYGQGPDGQSILPSHLASARDGDAHLLRIIVGTRVYTDDGRTERVVVPISGHGEYLRAFAAGGFQFPGDAKLPATKDLEELFRIYHLYPSCSHGHLSYSPDGEYICWDGSPSVYRTRDGGDRHDLRISPNGFCYHTCWFYDPRFFITGVRSYRTDYDRPINAGILAQAFTDGTWQAICDIKMRPNAFYYGGNFATFSRDTTKIHYASSMLGVPKNYIAVRARPQPPRGLTWKADGDAVILSWAAPTHHREIRGYLVYRSERSGDGYRLLTPEPVAVTRFRDAAAQRGRAYHYVATSLEHSGLESGFSSEAARAGVGLPAKLDTPLVVYAEAEDALADLGSAARPGLSTGRDRLAASDWHYLYRTPDAKEGQASLRVSAPADAGYHLWLRVRKGGAASGQWRVLIDGKPAGQAECARGEWTWVRAAPEPVRLAAGRHEVALATGDEGAQADLVCLATDRAFTPSGVRPEGQQAPGPIGGLAVTQVRERDVSLKWRPGPTPGLSHYNVYAARQPFSAPDQKYLIGSPTTAKFIDWGLRAGTTYHYAVTAVDRRGRESALGSIVRAETPARPHPPVTVELHFDQAKLEGAFQRAAAPGTRAKEYVLLPKPAAGEGATARATWEIDLPHAGSYAFWLRALPRGEPSSRAAAVAQSLKVLLDGKEIATVGGGDTDLSVGDKNIRPEFWTWARPVEADLITVNLPAGKHTLALARFTPEVRYDTLVLTDEPSFQPADGRLRQR